MKPFWSDKYSEVYDTIDSRNNVILGNYRIKLRPILYDEEFIGPCCNKRARIAHRDAHAPAVMVGHADAMLTTRSCFISQCSFVRLTRYIRFASTYIRGVVMQIWILANNSFLSRVTSPVRQFTCLEMRTEIITVGGGTTTEKFARAINPFAGPPRRCGCIVRERLDQIYVSGLFSRVAAAE